jgi:hypothetical protein
MNLLYNSEFVPSTAVMIGVKSTLYSNPVDMKNAVGCLFIIAGNTEFGGFATSGGFHVQASTYSSGGWANYGSTIAVYSSQAANGAKRIWALDVVKPTKRYLRAAAYHTTGDFQFINLKYGLRRRGTSDTRDDSKCLYGINISTS